MSPFTKLLVRPICELKHYTTFTWKRQHNIARLNYWWLKQRHIVQYQETGLLRLSHWRIWGSEDGAINIILGPTIVLWSSRVIKTNCGGSGRWRHKGPPLAKLYFTTAALWYVQLYSSSSLRSASGVIVCQCSYRREAFVKRLVLFKYSLNSISKVTTVNYWHFTCNNIKMMYWSILHRNTTTQLGMRGEGGGSRILETIYLNTILELL